jgi:tryptophan-rich sensory protein
VTWTVLIASIVATLVGLIDGLVTKIGPWYQGLRKPLWQPPNVVLRPWAPPAAWSLTPYLLWVSFAAYLNWTLVRLNWPFQTA